MDLEIKKLLFILGFEKETKKAPLMKEVRKIFFMLSRKKHPDKPGGSKQAFQELLDAYERIGKLIQDKSQEDVDDEEETLARNLFKETNFERINLYSITISILTIHVDAWYKVLCEKYGKPDDNSNTSNGMKFEVENYEYENHSSSLCVILLKKEKYKRSTLLIDAKRKQPICIDYVEKELPNLFEKVLAVSPVNPISSLEKIEKG